MMSLKHRLAFGAVVGATLAAAGPAGAQSVSKQQLEALQQQILQLQQQLQTLQVQVQQSETDAKKAQTSAAQAFDVIRPMAAAKPADTSPKVIQSGSNQFGMSSADGKNTIELTGRLQADYADYFHYSRASASTSPQDLNSGANLRRARLGVTGKFNGDFNYTFIVDLGGSSDTVNPLNGSNINSGVNNAFIQYTGFKPLVVTLGYVDTNWSLDESTSSNDIMFMERDTTETLANNIVAGDQRSVFGATWNTDRAWVGAFLTGPQSGIAHGSTVTTTAAPTITCVAAKAPATVPTCTNSSTTQNIGGSAAQLGGVARATYQLVQNDNMTLHAGVDGGWLIQPPHAAGLRAVSFSDRPELRVDPTQLISTGSITRVKNVGIYSAELAGNYGPFYAQGEFFHFDVDRESGASGGDFAFDGGYVEAAYTLTGESRKYNAGTGAYSGIKPDHPFQYKDGEFTGYGAWELAARVSQVSLNDKFDVTGRTATSVTTSGVEGGNERLYTAGINWYAFTNVKFLVNYIHGDVKKNNGTIEIGQKFDAIALRSQFTW